MYQNQKMSLYKVGTYICFMGMTKIPLESSSYPPDTDLRDKIKKLSNLKILLTKEFRYTSVMIRMI